MANKPQRSTYDDIVSDTRTDTTQSVETLPDDCVLIAGAGPVGLLLATVLAHYGVKSILLERNKTTTR